MFNELNLFHAAFKFRHLLDCDLNIHLARMVGRQLQICLDKRTSLFQHKLTFQAEFSIALSFLLNLFFLNHHFLPSIGPVD